IADALRRAMPSCEILFVGALGRMEMDRVPAAGYKIVGLPVAGFQRRLTWKNLSFFYRLAASMIKARQVIRSFRPDVAVGVGGYASGPVLRAAAAAGVRSEEHTSELQSRENLVCRLLLEKKKGDVRGTHS